jgi:hypothetical protein
LFEKDDDQRYNSAHIKAARKILIVLQRLRARREAKLSVPNIRLNDESESRTVQTSPYLKPASQGKRKSNRVPGPKVSIKNKLQVNERKTTPLMRDNSKTRRELSAIDSNNMLIEYESVHSARAANEENKLTM